MRWFDHIVTAVRTASSSSALPVQAPGTDSTKKGEAYFQARVAVYAAGIAFVLPGLQVPVGSGAPAPKSPPISAPTCPTPKSPNKKTRAPPGGPAANVERRLLKRRSSAPPPGAEEGGDQGAGTEVAAADEVMSEVGDQEPDDAV